MPKIRRRCSLSSDQSRAPFYPSSSMTIEQHQPNEQLGSANDVKEWEEARCPICMEHPHNAILLKCSSHEKGCRPYMCNTSYRHSNCLDQFCKSSAPHASTALLREIPLTSSAVQRREDGTEPGQARQCGSDLQPKLLCPLCRGEVYGYSIVEPARRYMNLKTRSCSSEKCDFSGTYSELRKHARSEHPFVRPSEVDPERQRDWTRLERDRDLEDVLSSLHVVFGEESSEESTPSTEFGGLLSSLLEDMFRYLHFSLMASRSPVSREPSHSRTSGSTGVRPVAGRNSSLLPQRVPRSWQSTRWAHQDIGTASRQGQRQTPGWSSESTSRPWTSHSAYGRPRFQEMHRQSPGSMRNLSRYPRGVSENMPHPRPSHWQRRRWSPYNRRR